MVADRSGSNRTKFLEAARPTFSSRVRHSGPQGIARHLEIDEALLAAEHIQRDAGKACLGEGTGQTRYRTTREVTLAAARFDGAIDFAPLVDADLHPG